MGPALCVNTDKTEELQENQREKGSPRLDGGVPRLARKPVRCRIYMRCACPEPPSSPDSAPGGRSFPVGGRR